MAKTVQASIEEPITSPDLGGLMKRDNQWQASDDPSASSGQVLIEDSAFIPQDDMRDGLDTAPIHHNTAFDLSTHAVPDHNPFVLREARRLRNTYMAKLGLFLYLVGLALYVIRVAMGDLPSVSLWVYGTTIGV